MQPPARRRVVVTGLGAVTPVGNTRDDFWRRLVAGESGIASITAFDASDFITRIAGEVKDFKPEELIGRKEARRMDRFTQFAFVAAREAIEDAKLPVDAEFKQQVGGVIGTGIGGIITFWLNSDKANDNGTWAKVTPFFIPMLMANAAPAHISMAYGYQGPFFAAASACASANDAICTAYSTPSRTVTPSQWSPGGSEGDRFAAGNRRFLFDARDVDAQRRPLAREPPVRQGARRLRPRGGRAGILGHRGNTNTPAPAAHVLRSHLPSCSDTDNRRMLTTSSHRTRTATAACGWRSSAYQCSTGIEPSDVDYINAHGTSTPRG